jgi:hypothetical protein
VSENNVKCQNPKFEIKVKAEVEVKFFLNLSLNFVFDLTFN